MIAFMLLPLGINAYTVYTTICSLYTCVGSGFVFCSLSAHDFCSWLRYWFTGFGDGLFSRAVTLSAGLVASGAGLGEGGCRSGCRSKNDAAPANPLIELAGEDII